MLVARHDDDDDDDDGFRRSGGSQGEKQKVTLIRIVAGVLETILKGLVKGLEDVKIRGDHSDYIIIKIGLNTEKSPGDLRALNIP